MHGFDIPLLANVQPAGVYLGERFHRAGGVPAIMWELLKAGKLDGSARRLQARRWPRTCKAGIRRSRGHRALDAPLRERAGFLVLKGNLFDFAIMKMSVVSEGFRERYLCEPGREGVFEGKAVVFDGSEDYHKRINDPELDIDENTILVIRGAGPMGWPGSAEVVNDAAAGSLAEKVLRACRRSATVASPVLPTARRSSMLLARECRRRRSCLGE